MIVFIGICAIHNQDELAGFLQILPPRFYLLRRNSNSRQEFRGVLSLQKIFEKLWDANRHRDFFAIRTGNTTSAGALAAVGRGCFLRHRYRQSCDTTE